MEKTPYEQWTEMIARVKQLPDAQQQAAVADFVARLKASLPRESPVIVGATDGTTGTETRSAESLTMGPPRPDQGRSRPTARSPRW